MYKKYKYFVVIKSSSLIYEGFETKEEAESYIYSNASITTLDNISLMSRVDFAKQYEPFFADFVLENEFKNIV